MFASTARPYDKRFNRKAWTLHCRHSRSKVAVGGDPERSPTARKLRHGTARTLITQTGGSVLVKAPKEHPRGANAVISTRRIHLGGGLPLPLQPGRHRRRSKRAVEQRVALLRRRRGRHPGWCSSTLALPSSTAAATRARTGSHQQHLEQMLAPCADPTSGEPVGGAPK